MDEKKRQPFRSVTIEIPECCVVALVGGSSSGKSSFAARHFLPTEVLSSDCFRGMIIDNENDQSISAEAFDLLYYAANKRLHHRKLTVIDATNLQQAARRQVVELAGNQNVHAVAIVLDTPESVMQARNKARPDRGLPEQVIRRHCSEVRRSIRSLRREGFRFVYVLSSVEEMENAEIVRTRMWNNKRECHGPFDIIGDIHGCCTELEELLEKLGYTASDGVYRHPDGRQAAFLGDFCDRGDRNADVLRLVMRMVQAGTAIAVPGNHDVKLLKYLRGKNIAMTHGIDRTIAELEACEEGFRKEAEAFLDGLVSHYELDDGRLVIAHAGLREDYIGRASGRVREFCLYGEVTGETDEFGLPVRHNWAADYRGRATVVYGHIAGTEVTRLNRTVCIDTGCVFGGKLTAYRYPEGETVSVAARKVYYEPIRPLEAGSQVIDRGMGDILTVGDFGKKLHIETKLMPAVDIHENNAAAALEIMSRFAADPHWLIYLPPTMSPCETSGLEDYLEHPLEAFGYYRERGVQQVVCEKKHMGSRCVIVLCRDEETARKRFGVDSGARGVMVSRTGRPFFDTSPDDPSPMEPAVLERMTKVLTATRFWEDFGTDWVCLDAELMPWSQKAQALLRTQYAPTGRAGVNSLTAAVRALEQACRRPHDLDGESVDPQALLEKYSTRLADMEKYVAAYREYCWHVTDVNDLRIAPFHVLACEGQVFDDKTHVWHMETIRRYLTGQDDLLMATPYLCVDTGDEQSVREGVDWWLSLTGSGGEGMVVKPETFTAFDKGRLLQPAVKCRGREYLRIIYGASYTEPEHLARLKKRSLNRKRQLAVREFSLGMESLHRFVEGEPLYRVHECAFGVLALESEPVDPRL